MMDPISIAFSCFTLIEIVSKASTRIHSFITGYRDAQHDLAAVDRELVELGRVLGILKNELQNDDATGFEDTILPIIEGCREVTETIDEVLDEHRRKRGAVKWTLDGKQKVQKLQATLEEHRRNLSLVVGTMSL